MLTPAIRAALLKATDVVDQSAGQVTPTPVATGDPSGPQPGAVNPSDPLSVDETKITDLKAKIIAGITAAKAAAPK